MDRWSLRLEAPGLEQQYQAYKREQLKVFFHLLSILITFGSGLLAIWYSMQSYYSLTFIHIGHSFFSGAAYLIVIVKKQEWLCDIIAIHNIFVALFQLVTLMEENNTQEFCQQQFMWGACLMIVHFTLMVSPSFVQNSITFIIDYTRNLIFFKWDCLFCHYFIFIANYI